MKYLIFNKLSVLIRNIGEKLSRMTTQQNYEQLHGEMISIRDELCYSCFHNNEPINEETYFVNYFGHKFSLEIDVYSTQGELKLYYLTRDPLIFNHWKKTDMTMLTINSEIRDGKVFYSFSSGIRNKSLNDIIKQLSSYIDKIEYFFKENNVTL